MNAFKPFKVVAYLLTELHTPIGPFQTNGYGTVERIVQTWKSDRLFKQPGMCNTS